MEKLKKSEAFIRATQVFGAWGTWSRWEHLAYGLIRGVPYTAMEKCSNDALDHWNIHKALLRLGAWPVVYQFEKDKPEPKMDWSTQTSLINEIKPLVIWVRKTIRGPRIRPSRGAEVSSAAGE